MPRNKISAQTVLGATAIAGFLNAVTGQVTLALKKESLAAALAGGMGVNPIVTASFILAIILTFHSACKPARRRHVFLALAMSFALLIPISTLAWVTLGVLSFSIILDKELPESMRAGASIMMAVALREPFTRILLDMLAEPLLLFDGWMTAFWMSVFHEQVSHQGNLVTGPNGNKLLILTGCSSFKNLSYSLLAWFAASRAFQSTFSRGVWMAGAGISISVPVFNHFRLALMGLDADAYAYFHAGGGRHLFEAGIAVITFVFTLWGLHHAHTHSFISRDRGQLRIT